MNKKSFTLSFKNQIIFSIIFMAAGAILMRYPIAINSFTEALGPGALSAGFANLIRHVGGRVINRIITYTHRPPGGEEFNKRN
jgi:hypothetical protein